METGNINIYGKLVAQTGEGKVADTDQIFDKTLGKFQSEINGERENYYTKDEIDSMVEAIKQFNIQIANTLPEASESTMFTIYLIPSSNPKTTNSKDEYITVKSGNAYSWEQVGSTEIDLSGYSTTEQMNAAILSGLNNLSFSTGEKVVNLGIDEEPIAGSDNLVKSGGVKNELALGAVYNVSAKNPTAGHNSDGKWESLYALLTDANLSTLIPTPVRKGGMSIKFIQSSDNKYVQWRLMLSTFTDAQFANPANWQGVDIVPASGSKNFVESGGVSESTAFAVKASNKLTPTSAEQGKYLLITSDSAGISNASQEFGCATYDLSGLSGYLDIEGATMWANYYYAFFSSSEISISSLISHSPDRSPNSNTKTKKAYFNVAIPQGAVVLVINTVYNSDIVCNVYSKEQGNDILPQVFKNVPRVDVTQNFTEQEKKKIINNIGEENKKFIYLEYWGQTSSQFNALNKGSFFYNTYDKGIYIKTADAGEAGVMFFNSYTKKSILYYYRGNLYTYIGGDSLTNITTDIIEQSTGLNTDKTISQKVITEQLLNKLDVAEFNAKVVIESKNVRLVETYRQWGKLLVSKTIQDTSIIAMGVAVYNVSGLTGTLNIKASTNYTNIYYAFFSSTEIIPDNWIENSAIGHSGNTPSQETFSNIRIPNGAVCLVINIYNTFTENGVVNNVPIVSNILNSDTLFGKKWACVGDSLTEYNSKTTKHYFDYIAEENGVVPLNYGYSGSGYARLKESNKAFYQRVSSIDLSSDIITIFGSFNDLGSELPLGSWDDDDDTTIAGCINLTLDNIYTHFPAARIGIIAPTPWASFPPETYSNSINYVNMLETISKKRSIPFLNLWICSNLRPWTQAGREATYTKDNGAGTHPDETGHSIIAPKIREFIKMLL